jgi:hypothetical protein
VVNSSNYIAGLPLEMNDRQGVTPEKVSNLAGADQKKVGNL